MISGSQFQSLTLNNASKMQSVLSEPIIFKLQREVDLYTKKLEQEKRRLFGMDETFSMLNKELKEKKENVAKLQKQTRTTEFKKILSTIKNLENNLDKTIMKFNETLAQNKSLQSEIDILRRDRNNFLKIHSKITVQLVKKDEKRKEMKTILKNRKEKNIETQYQIHLLKSKNEEEKYNYVSQFDNLQEQIQEEKRMKEILNKSISKPKDKIENFDTHTLLKRRLQKIILNNKEKVKVIDQYQKNMRIIDEAFNQIKEGSGITDIEEITNTFIKSQEQNFSLYAYVDILTQDIDNLEDENFFLNEKIKSQETENDEREKILKGTPDDKKQRNKIQQIIDKKKELLNDLQKTLEEIQTNFVDIFLKFDKSIFKNTQLKSENYDELEIILNENNIDQYFANLEGCINNMLSFKIKAKGNNEKVTEALLLEEIPIKDYIAKNNQMIQLTHEDYGETRDMIDPKKFRDIAIDILDRKNKSTLNISAGNNSIIKKK